MSDYLGSITDYEKAVGDKTTACCEQQKAGVPLVEYTPAYVECDFKV